MDLSTKISERIASKGLKVTPQRIRVLEAINKLEGHPTAENIIEYIRKKDPNIGVGTVYKVLEVLVKKELIKKVKTAKGIMRYDGMLESHHHLYGIQCDYIQDYKNEKLDELLSKFFEENRIENFNINDIRLQISGDFIEQKNKNYQ